MGGIKKQKVNFHTFLKLHFVFLTLNPLLTETRSLIFGQRSEECVKVNQIYIDCSSFTSSTQYLHCRDEVITSIAYSLLIPNVLFVLSLIVLVYWYCPYCQAKCKNYQQADLDDK